MGTEDGEWRDMPQIIGAQYSYQHKSKMIQQTIRARGGEIVHPD